MKCTVKSQMSIYSSKLKSLLNKQFYENKLNGIYSVQMQLIYSWLNSFTRKKTAELRAFIGVETAALTFRMKQYSTSCSSHICYGKRFFNDFFLNHHTIALPHNCLNYSVVWSLRLLWAECKISNYLKSPFNKKTYHLTSSRTVLYAIIVMHVHRQL